MTAPLSVQKFLPQSNAPGVAFTLQNNFISGAPNLIDKRVGSIKIDHSFSDRQRINGNFHYDRSPSIRPNAFGNEATPTLGPQIFARRGVSIEDVYTINPTTVLNVRYGLSRVSRMSVRRSPTGPILPSSGSHNR